MSDRVYALVWVKWWQVQAKVSYWVSWMSLSLLFEQLFVIGLFVTCYDFPIECLNKFQFAYSFWFPFCQQHAWGSRVCGPSVQHSLQGAFFVYLIHFVFYLFIIPKWLKSKYLVMQSAGMQAIDEIVPTLLHALEGDTSDTALDGLKQILRWNIHLPSLYILLSCSFSLVFMDIYSAEIMYLLISVSGLQLFCPIYCRSWFIFLFRMSDLS